MHDVPGVREKHAAFYRISRRPFAIMTKEILIMLAGLRTSGMVNQLRESDPNRDNGRMNEPSTPIVSIASISQWSK